MDRACCPDGRHTLAKANLLLSTKRRQTEKRQTKEEIQGPPEGQHEEIQHQLQQLGTQCPCTGNYGEPS